MELKEGRQMYDALENECQWMKKEASTYLTNLYSLRESNYKLTQDLEEEHTMVERLQERYSFFLIIHFLRHRLDDIIFLTTFLFQNNRVTKRRNRIRTFS